MPARRIPRRSCHDGGDLARAGRLASGPACAAGLVSGGIDGRVAALGICRLNSCHCGLASVCVARSTAVAPRRVGMVGNGWRGGSASVRQLLRGQDAVRVRAPASRGRRYLHPLRPGPLSGGAAGSNTLVNDHMRTRNASAEQFRPRRGQSDAIDFFSIGFWDLRTSGW